MTFLTLTCLDNDLELGSIILNSLKSSATTGIVNNENITQ